jgi:hypothetical protein
MSVRTLPSAKAKDKTLMLGGEHGAGTAAQVASSALSVGAWRRQRVARGPGQRQALGARLALTVASMFTLS